MKKLVVLTGSGISAESGLKTFRDMDGLWEHYDVTEVASPEGWFRDQELVLRFYNDRRAQLEKALPNTGHKGLAELEKFFDVHIITQNVDNLHERAGSTKVLHLHGLLTKVESTGDPSLVYDIGYGEVKLGDTCEKGYQLRPHIVWFGEAVPAISEAANIVSGADFFAIIGTSLLVYPAAGLTAYVPHSAPVYVIDPNKVPVSGAKRVEFIRKRAGEGVKELKNRLIQFTKQV